jgi:hypothetical protein
MRGPPVIESAKRGELDVHCRRDRWARSGCPGGNAHQQQRPTGDARSGELHALYTRQDMRLACYLLVGILIMLGIIADKL